MNKESDENYNINHVIFLSSDESDDSENDNNIKSATTGINIMSKTNIRKHHNNILPNPNNESSISSEDENVNGWDDSANNTINNWYNLFRQQSFIYQWVIERNKKISNNLMIASIIASTTLGIFSSFKLWIKNNEFSTISDVLLIITNFSVAFITNYSKSYIDDKRNEIIRIYIDEVDELLGEISGQVLKSPKYRINANDFFKDHNYKYTKLITYIPNISIYELNESKKEYEEFKKHFNQ